MAELPIGDDGRYPVFRTRYTEARLPIHFRSAVLRRDNYRCVFCGSSCRLEVDHIIPWSAGGSDDIDNLRTLCHWCNVDRSNFKVADDNFRRIPNGGECVNCQANLIGEPDVIAIYCVTCGAKAPGLPFNDQPYQPRQVELDDDMPDELWEARQRAALVARIRASAPPAPMPEDEDDDEVRHA